MRLVFFALVLLKLMLVLAFVAVPGLWLLRIIQFRYRNPLDLVLALSATGLAVSGGCVYLLLLAGLYYSVTPFLVLLLPGAWLAREYRRTRRLLPSLLVPLPKRPAPAPGVTALNRIAVAGCGVLLSVLFCDAITSPLRMWDAVITWDKWAVNWAARSNLYHTAQGGYPQLLPMFSSLLYKTTRSYSQPVPGEQYALHGFHVVLGLLLLLAVVRATQLLELPVWGTLAAVFGFTAMQGIIPFGTADLLVTLLIFVTVVLWFAWKGEEWEARFDGVPVLAACIFAAAFSKATGVAALVFLALAHAGHRHSKDIRSSRYLPGRSLAVALLAPLLLLLPFYLTQVAASREPIERHNSMETNMSASGMLPGLKTVADDSYAGLNGLGRFRSATGRFLSSYSIPKRLYTAGGALLVILACAGALGGSLVPVFFTALLLFISWYIFASYDLRNVLPAIPLFGVCVTAGAVRIWQTVEPYRWARVALIGAVSGCLLLMASTVLSIAPGFARASFSASHWAARLEAAPAAMPDRIAPFFPDEYRMWIYLSRQGLLRRAGHLVNIGVMYRWHPGGIYGYCPWDPRVLGPGDLFVASPPVLPPGSQGNWRLLEGPAPLRAWILEKAL